MRYEGDIYRPPSEAGSLLVQVTIGCAWNRCTFCTMYKDKRFRVRHLAEIREDLEQAARLYGGGVKRIFLCDGDALVLKIESLRAILNAAWECFPSLEGVRSYASAFDVLQKTPGELAELRGLGLEMVYIGLESGSDAILESAHKRERRADFIEAAARLKRAGILQSISIIGGLGGEARWGEHAVQTAAALNAMQPEYVGLLTLTAGTDSLLLVPDEALLLREMRLLIENLELENCLFTSAHMSNYTHLRGRLPQDKAALLSRLDAVI